ncbi:NeuD/PglB/VioB family sugar acetyltransferase [Desulfobacula phenolica]|uniref:Sugar O-acyltransferase, sialic acid O-acetyltransferase NeuD family n=1 Tax=Desulfobacula phenolica TaxID=90732 RepID=A0A1H2DRY4_9BACT|nr:NeuD/PglB/VioB family sugar acetyltransferase [Desulfobacula phenolica]SDT85663.1 sugar O-acyltransferase, sialic acid O-acetyltransferase NeuD family [Desulfobacula phenolica]
MSEKEIILVGGGGHCRSCIDVIETGRTFSIAGIVEQPGKDKSGPILGYPVIGFDNDLEILKKQYDYALITVGQVGSSNVRQRLFNLLKQTGFILPVVVSPLAYVSKRSQIGEGSIVMHHAIVNAGAGVGKNCILNTRCLIEHDAKIGNHTHISTAAVLNGEAKVGSGSFVGSNSTVVQGARLPDHFFFKAGSLIAGEKDGKIMKDNKL